MDEVHPLVTLHTQAPRVVEQVLLGPCLARGVLDTALHPRGAAELVVEVDLGRFHFREHLLLLRLLVTRLGGHPLVALATLSIILGHLAREHRGLLSQVGLGLLGTPESDILIDSSHLLRRLDVLSLVGLVRRLSLLLVGRLYLLVILKPPVVNFVQLHLAQILAHVPWCRCRFP